MSFLESATGLLEATYAKVADERTLRGDGGAALDIAHDLQHVKLVHEWVLRIDPQASVELQLAALFHDVERAFRTVARRDYDSHIGYKMAHAREGARIATDLLATIPGSDRILIERVRYLITFHEADGTGEDLSVLRDADGIAFLLGDTDYYQRRKAPGVLAKKISYSLDRLSERGRRVLACAIRDGYPVAPDVLRQVT